jgi:hypothetical protein
MTMTDPDLRTELLRRLSLDQAAREHVEGYSEDPRMTEWAAVREIDSDNTAWLAAIVTEHGWPRQSEIGEDAATAAWLLAQHADDNPELQKTFHQHMTSATELGEASPRLLAYLEDRVRVNAGRPQLYGTQFVSDDTGALRPQPIHNLESLNQRRAAAGMEPFEEYEATMHGIWTRNPS